MEMKTLTLETEIASDGSLHLNIPAGLPPGKSEVVIVVQPLPQIQPPYVSLAGVWQDFFPPDFDIDQALHEIRHEWVGRFAAAGSPTGHSRNP